jgi:uncharacterized hydantoinase/oxoprolinase family protein
MLSSDEIQAIASHVAAEQIRQIVGAISQVLARNDVQGPLIASGSGAFLVQTAAQQLELPCHALTDVLDQAIAVGEKGLEAAVTAPAFAIAVLLSEECRV